MSFLKCLLGDLVVIWAESTSSAFILIEDTNVGVRVSTLSPNHAKISANLTIRHKKDSQADIIKWKLLLHFSTYLGHSIISHTFHLCSSLTLATCVFISSLIHLPRSSLPPFKISSLMILSASVRELG